MREHFRIAALSCAAITLYGSMAHAQAVLSIDPITQTTTTGSTVIVGVDISNVIDLYAYQFDLAFNPSVLQAVSSSEGPFLASGGSTFFIPGNDNVGGTVSATANTLLSAVSGVNGSGQLAAFTFSANGKGSSTLTIQNETLLDSALNFIADTTTGGSVAVTSGGMGATGAPEIDPASAMSGLTLLLGGLAVLRGRRRIR